MSSWTWGDIASPHFCPAPELHHRLAIQPVCDKIGGAKVTSLSGIGLTVCAVLATRYTAPTSVEQFSGFLWSMLGLFFFSGMGNASIFKQMPMIFPVRQASGVIGWISAVATFGVVYRYGVWLEKPPTALYWKRGWQLFLRPSHLVGNVLHLVTLAWNNLIAQTFIEKRSHTRWVAHFLISWGFLIACAVTFPLVFGWVAFEADPSDPAKYITFVFGFAALSFPAHSLFGWIIFHILDFCAVAILIGMGFAFKRRLYDPGALSVQQFANDFFPLILLFAVCLTGLMLTASAVWMQGHNYSFLATLHAFSVITTLLYLPFGKFFHVFQRPANIGVQFCDNSLP